MFNFVATYNMMPSYFIISKYYGERGFEVDNEFHFYDNDYNF